MVRKNTYSASMACALFFWLLFSLRLAGKNEFFSQIRSHSLSLSRNFFLATCLPLRIPMSPSSPQHSHIISQQVFGSSKKLQFIGLSPMDSLLTAIDQQEQQQQQQDQQTKSTQQTMSIESLLDSNGDTLNKSNKRNRSGEDKRDHSEGKKTSRRRTMETVSVVPASSSSLSVVSQSYWKSSQMTTITCYHASVAQKSYGSEKRFLCPPPVVRFQSPSTTTSANIALTPEEATLTSPSCHLTMAVMNENGDVPLEQQAVLDEEDQCTFKYLHVTGSAKAKQFSLRINISSHDGTSYTSDHSPPSSNNTSPCLSPSSSPSPTGSPLSSPPHQHREHQPQSYATFLSKPISIISKPSKKTAKTRNVTTCILANRPVSFYNRINSQTVRTKYMTSEDDHLCAKNTSWSPFEIIIIRQPPQKQHSSSSKANPPNVIPLVYGSELMLRDTRTGIRSQPLVIRKVDRGRIVPGASGPVSQMQKVALQLVTSTTSSSSLPRCQSMYLSALGATTTTTATTDSNGEAAPVPASQMTTTILDYAASRMIPDGLEAYEKVEDHLCWTIVGISTFEYSFYDNQPKQASSAKKSLSSSTPSTTSLPSSPTPPRCITPFPVLSNIQYKPSSHTLEIIGQHLEQSISAMESPTLLSLWLGSHHGPLPTTIQSTPPPDQTHLLADLPSTQDLIVANHDLLVNHGANSRTLELPLYFVRQDGVVYHSGKALHWELLVSSDTGRWSIVDLRQ